MRYDNLKDLISNSSSSRQYFLSQPVKMQKMLHLQNEYIHTAAELHSRVDLINRHERAAWLSESLF